MAENRAKETWKRGEIAYGAWLSIPSSLSSEALGRAGYDYVCVDLQHGLIEYPIAAGIDESGTGMTTSASIPLSRASSIPRRWRTW